MYKLHFTIAPFLEHGNTPFKNSFHIGDCCSIVYHRYIRVSGAFQPVFHLTFIQHTPSAVYDQPEGGKIQWKFCSAGEFEFRRCAGMFPNPRRKLLCADISALPVVGTALADQHAVFIRQRIQGSRTVYHVPEVSLIPSEQDGK